jgi:hypothetical protein
MRSQGKQILSGAVLLALVAGSGAAQQVGRVARIAEKKGVFVDATSRAELWHMGGELRTEVRRADTLLYQDIVRLRDRIIIDLQFRQPTLETNVYLGSRQLSDVGSYEILRDSVGAVSGLTLVVKQGVMVVEHARGQLLILAAGIRTRIFGTTVLFQVEPGAARATAFLREGHIGFPDYNVEASGKDRAWRLEPGHPPVELVLTGQELRRWQQEVKYTTQSVWQARAFWQKPSFLVPAAAVVVGGVGCLAAGCFDGGGGGTSQGGVVITIP